VHTGLLDALPEKIVVDIYRDGADIADNAVAIFKSHAKDQTNTSVFEYSVWANPGEKLTFAPRDSRYVFLYKKIAAGFVFSLQGFCGEKWNQERKNHVLLVLSHYMIANLSQQVDCVQSNN
jgi:hypothetical protein